MKLPVLDFKCPQCGRRNVHPYRQITKIHGTTTNFSDSGISLNDSNVDAKSMWLCDDCGHRFKDVNEWYRKLNDPNERDKNRMIDGFLGALLGFLCAFIVILAILLALDFNMPFDSELLWIIIVVTLLLIGSFWGASWGLRMEKERYEKNRAELFSLAEKCNAGNEIYIMPNSDSHYKYCPKCNARVSNDAAFCEKCGTSLSEY